VSSLSDSILNVNAVLAYVLVGLLVFAEDALFVGFVLPGETAAVLGGVVASRGHVNFWLMLAVVIAAAIIGDTVGYEIGKHVGSRLLNARILRKRRAKLDQAQDFLRRRGGAAVFLGRFVAFFRAVMPALAGTSRMPYPRFLTFNAAGGFVWGTIYVTLGLLAGNSYALVGKTFGRDLAAGIGIIVILALIAWQIHKRLKSRNRHDAANTKDNPT
jgi:membrane-associated protein